MNKKNEEGQENYLKHKNQQSPAPYLRIKALSGEQDAPISF